MASASASWSGGAGGDTDQDDAIGGFAPPAIMAPVLFIDYTWATIVLALTCTCRARVYYYTTATGWVMAFQDVRSTTGSWGASDTFELAIPLDQVSSLQVRAYASVTTFDPTGSGDVLVDITNWGVKYTPVAGALEF